MMLAAHQAHYLPHPSLLAKIRAADVFVLQDDLQYVKQNWQNRNRARTADGWRWLTVPVHASSRALIRDVITAERGWWRRHRRVIESLYRGCPVERLAGIWSAIEMASDGSFLDMCRVTLVELMQILEIGTPVVLQSELRLTADETRDRDTRLISLCLRLKCDTYLSGAGARKYLQPGAWVDSGIALRKLQWLGTPYPQCHQGWVPDLSVIDLILCCADAHRMIRCDARVVEMFPIDRGVIMPTPAEPQSGPGSASVSADDGEVVWQIPMVEGDE